MKQLYAQRHAIIQNMDRVYHTDPTEFSNSGNWNIGLAKKRTTMGILKSQLTNVKLEIELAQQELELGEDLTETPYYTRVEMAENSPELMGFSFEDPKFVQLDETRQYHREQAVHEDSEKNNFSLLLSDEQHKTACEKLAEKLDRELTDQEINSLKFIPNWADLKGQKNARIERFLKSRGTLTAMLIDIDGRQLYELSNNVRSWANKAWHNRQLTKDQRDSLLDQVDEAWDHFHAQKALKEGLSTLRRQWLHAVRTSDLQRILDIEDMAARVMRAAA